MSQVADLSNADRRAMTLCSIMLYRSRSTWLECGCSWCMSWLQRHVMSVTMEGGVWLNVVDMSIHGTITTPACTTTCSARSAHGERMVRTRSAHGRHTISTWSARSAHGQHMTSTWPPHAQLVVGTQPALSQHQPRLSKAAHMHARVRKGYQVTMHVALSH